MADSQFYTQEAAMAKATTIKTALALSKLRLCQDPFTPNPQTTKAQLVAAEAVFDGYPDGGFALTAWTGPLTDPNGGADITGPLVNVAYGPAGDPPATAMISAGWVEDATGNVRFVFIYNPSRPLALVGDGWPIVPQLVEARNSVTSFPT